MSEANKGKKYLPDTLIKMSEVKKGENSMFGRVVLNAKRIYIYTLDNKLEKECSSISKVATWLNTYSIKIDKYLFFW